MLNTWKVHLKNGDVITLKNVKSHCNENGILSFKTPVRWCLVVPIENVLFYEQLSS